MKKLIAIAIGMAMTLHAVAQENIKRPDSYNYQSGVDAYNEGDFKKSMDFFSRELQQNPKNGYAMLWQAYIYRQYDMHGDAMSCVNGALKNIPKKDKQWNGIALAFRGRLQALLGDTIKALEDYELAFKTYNSQKFLFEKCDILHTQERYDDVDLEIKRAMALNPNDAITWVYAGRNEKAKGNFEAAIEKYDHAVKLDPNYSSAYSFRAETHFALRQYKEAARDDIAALAIDQDAKAYIHLYLLADSALNVLAPQLKAQQLKEPNNYEWSYYLGTVLSYKDRHGEAEKAFKEALRIAEYEGHDRLQICQNLARTLNELGKYDEALEISDACLALDSTDYRTWRDRTEICYNLGKNMQAIENANRAIGCAPDRPSLYAQRARIYMYSKMYRNALDDIDTAISLDEDDSSLHIEKCEILRKAGDSAAADRECRLVIDRESAKPEEEQDLQSLAYAYARSSQRTKALPVIEKVYKDMSKDSEYDMACMYSLVGEKEAAISHLGNALRLGFMEFVHIDNDTDLDNIRETDQFKRQIAQYKQKYMDGAGTDGLPDEYVEQVTEVPFTKEAGIYKVKCDINGLPLHFFFDTGAADVTISSVEAMFMLKNDYLKPADIKGKEYYGTASGEIAEGTVVILRNVNFGGLELTNVKASVVHNQKAPLLLGQTVLNRLGKIEIDYDKNLLRITARKRR